MYSIARDLKKLQNIELLYIVNKYEFDKVNRNNYENYVIMKNNDFAFVDNIVYLKKI